MSKLCRCFVVLAFALGCVGVWSLGAGRLEAQTGASVARPAYQYVGVEQTIARIELTTGKIEILEQPESTRASLLVKHPKPWEWREVATAERRSDSAGPGAAPRTGAAD